MTAFATLQEKIAFSAEKMAKCNIFDSANMFCDAYCFEPGQVQKAHAHDGSDKVYYVLDGVVEIQIGDDTRRLEAGELAHAGPGVPHGATNPGPERATVLVFMAPKP
ncbi:MAG: cupin domain-containing protein [Candidatus Binatia bacterium]|nr:cupin domain-containing protein [Candidatus Binatia bacterium]